MRTIIPLQREVSCPACMLKLDRLDWVAGFAFEHFGVQFGIRSNDGTILPSLLERIPSGWQENADPMVDRLYSVVVGRDEDTSSVRHYHLLYAGATPVARTLDKAELLERFRLHLQANIARSTRGWFFVKGGVVEWKGRAIVLLGEGMEAPVRALVEHGAVFYSSQYAVFDGQGHLYPFPAPLLSCRSEYRVAHGCERGIQVGSRALSVDLIVDGSYQAETVPKLRKLTSAQTLLALLAHAELANTDPLHALTMLRPLADGVQALRGHWNDPNRLAETILCRLDRLEAYPPAAHHSKPPSRVTALYRSA